MFLWYSEQVTKGNPLLADESQESEQAKEETRRNAALIRALVGGEERTRFTVLAEPVGGPGPAVGMELDDRWLISKTRSLGGIYTIVGQVHRVLTPDEWMQTIRLVEEGPETSLERDTMREAIASFTEPAAAMGLTVRPDDGEIHGPALWLEPIAIYR
jgi:hypothetical protein